MPLDDDHLAVLSWCVAGKYIEVDVLIDEMRMRFDINRGQYQSKCSCCEEVKGSIHEGCVLLIVIGIGPHAASLGDRLES